MDNIEEWTGKLFAETQALAHNRDRWNRLAHQYSTPTTPPGIKGARRRRKTSTLLFWGVTKHVTHQAQTSW